MASSAPPKTARWPCCPSGDCSATDGVPQECGLDCAVLFSNTYNNCHDTLDSVVGVSMPLFDHFVERCYQLVSVHEIDILGALGAAECPEGDVETGSGPEGDNAGPHTACAYSLQSCMAVPTKTVNDSVGNGSLPNIYHGDCLKSPPVLGSWHTSESVEFPRIVAFDGI